MIFASIKSMNAKHTSTKILWILFAGGAVQTLYFSSIAIFLHALGYSAFAISSCIAATALPHVFIGPVLGRFVDRSKNKSSLLLMIHIGMSFSLAVLCFAELENLQWIAGTGMLLFATLLSPYQSLFTHYLLPSLSDDEDYIYSHWEMISAISVVIGGALSALLLLVANPLLLIQLTSIAYAVSGILIWIFWKPPVFEKNLNIEKHRTSFERLKLYFVEDKTVLLAILGMWIFALSIDSLANNAQVIALKSISISNSWVALIASGFSILNMIGAKIYQKLPAVLKEDRLRFQSWLAFAVLILLLLSALALSIGGSLILLITVISFGIIEPFWHVNNTLLLRSRLPKNEYAELFSWIRSPRAVLTYLGTSLVGAAQDHQWLNYLCLLFFISMATLVLLQIVFRKGRQFIQA